MLIIKSLKFKYDQSLKLGKETHVRISYGTNLTITKKQPIQNQGKSLEWNQTLTLAIVFNRQIFLQIFPQHQFGYHKQEFNKVYSASFSISNENDYYRQLKVFRNNSEVGKLVIKFIYSNQRLSLNSSEDTKNQQEIVLSSILVHFDKPKGESVHFQIKLKSQQVDSSQLKIVNGEVTTLTPLYFLSSQEQNSGQLIIKIYVDRNYMYYAFVSINGIKQSAIKFRRVDIFTVDQKKAGILLLNAHHKKKRLVSHTSNKSIAKFNAKKDPALGLFNLSSKVVILGTFQIK